MASAPKIDIGKELPPPYSETTGQTQQPQVPVATLPVIQPGVVQTATPVRPPAVVQMVTPIMHVLPPVVVPIGKRPINVICPHCNFRIQTSVRKRPALTAYLSGTLLAMSGCIWGCCLIPCCISGCKDVKHSCPYCGGLIAIYRR